MLSFTHYWRKAESPDPRTLLLLHGTGGDEHNMVPLAGLVAPGLAILSPRGRVLENGMPRFFRRLAPGVLDEADLKERAAELAGFLGEAARSYGFDASKVVALGFSNGANIAAAMMLLGMDVPRDAILVRAMVPLVPTAPAALAGRRVLICAGRVDPMTTPDQPPRLAEMLRSAGAAVELHWSDAGHEMVEEDIAAGRHFVEVTASQRK